MISERANTKLLEEMIACNLTDVAKNAAEESKKQWKQRKNKKAVKMKKKLTKKANNLRGVSNIWCQLLYKLRQMLTIVDCVDQHEIIKLLNVSLDHFQEKSQMSAKCVGGRGKFKHVQNLFRGRGNPFVYILFWKSHHFLEKSKKI